jgi:hypothetical protein
MNVRVFLLFGLAAFFGVLWSSDQQYQQAQELARAARIRNAVAKTTPPSASLAYPAVQSGANTAIEAKLVVRGNGILTDRYTAQIEDGACWAQWRARQNLFFAQRRIARLVRAGVTWRDLAVSATFNAETSRAAARNAAAAPTVETH